MKSNATLSKIALVSSMLIFGSVGIFRRLIPLPSATLACYRGAAGALFLLVFMLITKKKIRHNIGNLKLLGLILTGVGIGINWILLFEAYNYTTVATATLCYYMQPTIVVLLSPLFFKEKLGIKKIVCVIIAFTGMIFVAGLFGGTNVANYSGKGILFGLFAAAFYSAVVIMNKKMSGVDVYEKTIIELASAAIVLIPYVLLTDDFTMVSLNQTAIIMLVIIGLVHTGLAYALYFGSMDAISIQSVALIGYLDPIAAMILSVIVLKESLSVYEIIGAVLILGATAVSELSKE